MKGRECYFYFPPLTLCRSRSFSIAFDANRLYQAHCCVFMFGNETNPGYGFNNEPHQHTFYFDNNSYLDRVGLDHNFGFDLFSYSC